MQTNDNEIKEDMELVPDEENDLTELRDKLRKSKTELQKCESDRKEYLEGWQRAKADFINFKNDEAKRLEDIGRFVTAGLVQDILPVLDSFDLAISHGLSKDAERGILLIRSQFEDIMHNADLRKFK